MQELTAARLRKLLSYDPETGAFTRLIDRAGKGGCAKAGTLAGSKDHRGYMTTAIDGRRYYGHRLAFLWMTGEWPKAGVDHIDRDRSNNAWGNLRDVKQSFNVANHVRARDLPRCVYRHGNRYVARVGKGHFGSFRTPEEASEAAQREIARREYAPFVPSA